MLIVLHPDISRQDQAAIEARVRELGFTPHAIEGAGRTAIGITGNKGPVDAGHFRELPGVILKLRTLADGSAGAGAELTVPDAAA